MHKRIEVGTIFIYNWHLIVNLYVKADYTILKIEVLPCQNSLMKK